ncbi:hypothetical protein [Halobacterium noricense]|uniref:hypothetical protein n=1 Tax=Halobacterium noricense TaxID=223182 RepID=UPI002FCD1330
MAIAAAFADLEVAESVAGPIPSSSEVLIETTVDTVTTDVIPAGPPTPWEGFIDTVGVSVSATELALRNDPTVPFSPTGAPMADGIQLTGTIESAHLFNRLDNYWGVTPVEWIALPAEAGLGICLIASEILYAGFEWQLANTLFSFSSLFDKVIVLESETKPVDLARAFDDMWVKANPANDWEFSEPNASAASVPYYRDDGATGSNLYVDATWDPRWDTEYIAPRVTFENMYPEELRRVVETTWEEMGFDHGPENEPES